MTDEVKYNSIIPETIEASGNFINSVKNPLFVIVIVLMIFFGGMLYFAGIMGVRLISSLNEMKVSLNEMKVSLDKNSEHVIQGNNLIQKFMDFENFKQRNKR